MRAFFVTSFPVPLLSHFFFVREMITGEGSAPSPSMFAGTSRQGCESVSPRSLPFYPPKFPRNSAQRGAPGHGLWASILWTPSLHFAREKVFLHHAVYGGRLQTFAPLPLATLRNGSECGYYPPSCLYRHAHDASRMPPTHPLRLFSTAQVTAPFNLVIPAC